MHTSFPQLRGNDLHAEQCFKAEKLGDGVPRKTSGLRSIHCSSETLNKGWGKHKRRREYQGGGKGWETSGMRSIHALLRPSTKMGETQEEEEGGREERERDDLWLTVRGVVGI